MKQHDLLIQHCLPLMDSYQSDLMHDLEQIKRFPDVNFLHATRSSGTIIQMLIPSDSAAWPAAGERMPYLFGMSTREHILRDGGDMIRSMFRQGDYHTWHYWNGKTLKKIDPSEALRIWSNYEIKTGDSWRMEKSLQRIPA